MLVTLAAVAPAARHSYIYVDLKNTSELSKFIDLLRKKGVKSFKQGELSLELLPEAPLSNYKRKQPTDTSDVIQTEEFSDEDALFWSSAGLPEEKAN